MRAGPRMSCRSSPRSAAVTQPAPYATSASVFPVTCATPNASRVIVTPGRGRSRLSPRVTGAPSGAGLNVRLMSRGVTVPQSGVSASYSCAWSRVFLSNVRLPFSPGGRIVHAAAA